jgi:hypothetical protein
MRYRGVDGDGGLIDDAEKVDSKDRIIHVRGKEKGKGLDHVSCGGLRLNSINN